MSEKVLIVDDEEDFLEIMAERMKSRGMEVFTSTSAEEALGMIDNQQFDAIVLDFMMPGMDGIQTLKVIKEKKPELQIILLTGHATVQKGVEAMKLGAMDFLEKPADLEILTERIKIAKSEKTLIVKKEQDATIDSIVKKYGF
jgi:two-component system, OmpR family, response regulator